MFKTFFWKIWMLGTFCSVLAIGLVLFGLINFYLLEKEEKEIFRQNLLLAQVITHEVESGYLKGLWPFKTLKMISDDADNLILWVAEPNGKLFWADDPSMIGATIQDPFLGSLIPINRISSFNGEKMELIAYPLKIELNEKPWTIFLGASLKPVEKAKREITLMAMYFFIPTVFLVIIIAFLFSRRVTKPLEKLRRGVEIIGRGDFKHEIDIKTGDEIEELAKAFNRMTVDLQHYAAALRAEKEGLEIKIKERTKELEELAHELDNKVKERTKELQQKLEELEKFYKLTVGRELKMIELKKMIEKLREKGCLKDSCFKGIKETPYSILSDQRLG